MCVALKYPGSEEDSVWDSMHVVKTSLEYSDSGDKGRYKVTSTVFLTLQNQNEKQGKIDMAGSITRFKEDSVALDKKQDLNDQHLA